MLSVVSGRSVKQRTPVRIFTGRIVCASTQYYRKCSSVSLLFFCYLELKLKQAPQHQPQYSLGPRDRVYIPNLCRLLPQKPSQCLLAYFMEQRPS